MKTAVQWLKEQYIDRGETIPSGAFQEALEMERVQIKKANMDGYKEGCTYHSFDHQPKTTEQYYNQTYNQNEG